MSDLVHPNLFELSPIPILCEDWSQVRLALLDRLANEPEDVSVFLRNNPDFVIGLRRHHAFVDANPAALRLLGIDSLATLRSKASALLPADVASNSQVLVAMARGSHYCTGERTLKTPDGRRVPILWHASLPDGKDGFERIYFHAVDISVQKRAQEALHVAQSNLNHAGRLSLVGELVASLVHEISQPITAIMNSAYASQQWLNRDRPNLDEVRTGLGFIGSTARGAAQIIGRVKSFSRRASTEFVDLDVRKLIAESAALVEPEANRQHCTMTIEVEAGLPHIVGDSIQIQQVLVNVIMNALQAMTTCPASEKSVIIRARSLGSDHVMFCIEDTGPGISESALGQIFEPFFTTKSDGVGLGLSICKRIVEAHGGRLWAASQVRGALIQFTLPIAVTPA
jgi:PAS domain S-box-containing protein